MSEDGKVRMYATAIMDSGEALDLYRNSTGELPPPIPSGCNSVTKTFVTKDGEPAIICKQKGFGVMEGETEDDANGYMAIVVHGAPSREVGFRALDQFLDSLKDGR